jgi:hypothetical protein
MLTVLVLIAVCAFIATIISAMGKCPLWVPVILLCLWVLLKSLPTG